ncbi:hypothetical protein FKM82_025149 [Ascaphus truei]
MYMQVGGLNSNAMICSKMEMESRLLRTGPAMHRLIPSLDEGPCACEGINKRRTAVITCHLKPGALNSSPQAPPPTPNRSGF